MIRCPSCQSLDVEVSGAAGRCNACGKRLDIQGGQAVVVAGPPGGVGVAPVAVILVAVLAGGGWWFTRPPAAPDVKPAESTPPAQTQPPPVASTPSGPAHAVVSDVREGSNEVGGRYWLGTYKNDGSAAIDRPGIVVKLTDASGAVKLEVRGDGPLERIEPGQTMPVFALTTEAPKGTTAKVEVVPPSAAAGPSWKTPLQVEGIAHLKQPLGTTVVVGEIVNPHDKRARFVDIAVVGLDAEGRPVSWGSGLPTLSDLEPKGREPFQVRMGTFEVESPVSFSAWASANLK